MLFRLIFSGFLFCLISGQAFAQSIEYSEEDEAFFESQRPYLEGWLAQRGLDQVLQIERMDTYSDMFVLTMTMSNFTHKDSVSSAWNTLKKSFDEVHVDSLEAELFHYLTFLMETPPNQTTIEIWDHQQDQRESCFYKAVFFENDRLSTEETAGCRDSEVLVVIPLKELPANTLNVGQDLKPADTLWQSATVFQRIENFATTYFEKKGGVMSVLEREGYLEFEVSGMQEEVLPAKGFQWLSGQKQERLLVTVDYVKLDDQFRINFRVNGKFGAGKAAKRRNHYRPMEPDYTEELEAYTLKFSEEVRTYLLRF